MNSLDEFYITLPSNVASFNSSNTIANYVTRLPQRQLLMGNWVVGLSEISYPYSWMNVDIRYASRVRVIYRGVNNNITRLIVFIVEPKMYDIRELSNLINNWIANDKIVKFTKNPKISIDLV